MALLRVVVDLQRHDVPPGKSWFAPFVDDLALQPAHDRCPELFLGGFYSPRKPLVIEQLQQRGVKLSRKPLCGVALRKSLCSKCGASVRIAPVLMESTWMLPPPGGGDIVRLIDDENVEPAWERGLARRGQHVAEQAERAIAFEEIDGCDQAGGNASKGSPGAPPFPAKFGEQLRIDDDEVEPELVAHLVAPLDLQRPMDTQREPVRARCRRISSSRTRPVSIVLPRPTSSAMSRLARGIWTALNHRVELVVLYGDAAAKRRLNGAWIGGLPRRPSVRRRETHRGARDCRIRMAQVVQTGGRLPLRQARFPR